jgi:hypothetical protein
MFSPSRVDGRAAKGGTGISRRTELPGGKPAGGPNKADVETLLAGDTIPEIATHVYAGLFFEQFTKRKRIPAAMQHLPV